jgi:hypothetical protein
VLGKTWYPRPCHQGALSREDLSRGGGRVSAVEIPLALPSALLDQVADLVAERLQAKPSLLSKTALAEFWGVKPRTIETYRSKGMPGYRVGRDVLYNVTECESWVERNGP